MPEQKKEAAEHSPPKTPSAEGSKNTGKDIEEGEEVSDTEKRGTILGPEAVLMFFIAILLDLFGLLCLALNFFFGIGEILSFIPDFLGLFIIGGWMLIRSGIITETKGVKKMGTKIFKRLGLSFLVELIPVVGNVAPCWTLAVYFELKNG